MSRPESRFGVTTFRLYSQIAIGGLIAAMVVVVAGWRKLQTV
jgi:hypothetical protein